MTSTACHLSKEEVEANLAAGIAFCHPSEQSEGGNNNFP